MTMPRALEGGPRGVGVSDERGTPVLEIQVPQIKAHTYVWFVDLDKLRPAHRRLPKAVP